MARNTWDHYETPRTITTDLKIGDVVFEQVTIRCVETVELEDGSPMTFGYALTQPEDKSHPGQLAYEYTSPFHGKYWKLWSQSIPHG